MHSRRSLLKLVATCLLGTAILANAAEPFRLLTVGNSFADDATSFFPQIAKAGGKDVVVYRANLGGHSLEQHASYLAAYLKDPADPKGRPYPALAGGEKASLPEVLKSKKWDAVTIQQYSLKSPDATTYEPFATELINEIRQDAPQAKIFVHQTWAYREDSPQFQKGDNTQAKMYENLKAAYETLAQKHGLKIIPVGTAFQNARATAEWKFTFPDPAFDYKNPPANTLPDQKGSLNVGWKWGKDKEGQAKFMLDANHASPAGKYLAACVFYEMLFGESVLDNSFVPPGLTPEQAAQLRRIAHDTVAAQK